MGPQIQYVCTTLCGTTLQRPVFNPQQLCFQPQTQFLLFTSEARVAALATCSGWSVYTRCFCLSPPQDKSGESVQQQGLQCTQKWSFQTRWHRWQCKKKKKERQSGNLLIFLLMPNYYIYMFIDAFCRKYCIAPVHVSAAAATCFYTQRFNSALPFSVWHFDQILTCHVSKDCCPSMFDVHRLSPAVQRCWLHHPRIYTHSSYPLWGLLSCVRIYPLTQHKADVGQFCTTGGFNLIITVLSANDNFMAPT